MLDRILGLLDELMVEGLVKTMVLGDATASADALGHIRIVQDGGEVEAARLPMKVSVARLKRIDTSDHLVHRAEAHPRHVLADLLGDKEEVVDDVLGQSGEFLVITSYSIHYTKLYEADFVGRGMHLEFSHPGFGEPIVTSAIVEIREV